MKSLESYVRLLLLAALNGATETASAVGILVKPIQYRETSPTTFVELFRPLEQQATLSPCSRGRYQNEGFAHCVMCVLCVCLECTTIIIIID